MDVIEPFLALVIYPTTQDAQSRQADNLLRLASEQVRLLPGFLRGRVASVPVVGRRALQKSAAARG